LAWAHAEFAKLVISRQLGRPVDRPTAVWRRYSEARKARCAFWFPHAPIGDLGPDSRLIVALPRPALIRWGIDGRDESRAVTVERGLGFEAVELDTGMVTAGRPIGGRWISREGAGASGEFRLVVRPKERDR